jgi:hypothetical protein
MRSEERVHLSPRRSRRRRAGWVAVALVLIPVLAAWGLVLAQEWSSEFDDAYITYRYAKNLATGAGLTWNPGEPPTEGYTNFLLVMVLAPAIAAGLDPMVVTRLLSMVALVGVVALLAREVARRFGLTTPSAVLLGLIVLGHARAPYVLLLGLETVLYACALVAAVLAGAAVLEGRGRPAMVGMLFLAAAWLRPEALLAAMIFGVWLVCTAGRASRRPLAWSLGLLGAVGVLYLGWKMVHFGALLPNPFYVKSATGELFPTRGLQSLRDFVGANGVLLALAAAGGIAAAVGRTQRRAMGFLGSVAAAYLAYYPTVDTLMDVMNRFYFPLVPLLVFLAAPALAPVLLRIELRPGRSSLVWVPVSLVWLLALRPALVADLDRALRDYRDRLRSGQAQAFEPPGPSPEVAALAAFPAIRQTRIAGGDAGVIPYFTEALWLDIAGLNDPVIARERDLGRLVDHVFALRPDLFIHAATEDHQWITFGHGPLGDYRSWSGDPRWDDYEYAGSWRPPHRLYQLHFLLRRDGAQAVALADWLRTRVVDGRYDVLPLPLGTQAAPATTPAWRPRPRPDGAPVATDH